LPLLSNSNENGNNILSSLFKGNQKKPSNIQTQTIMDIDDQNDDFNLDNLIRIDDT